MILFYLLCGYFVVVFTLKFVQRKWGNRFTLTVIFGKKGSGKTTFLAKKALEYSKLKNWILYTNVTDLAIPGIRYIDFKDLGRFVPEANSVLLLDEMGIYASNRDFAKWKAEQTEFWKMQRHWKCRAYMCSQSFDLDKKLRDLADYLQIQTQILGVFSIGRPVKRRITLTEPIGDQESKITDSFSWGSIFSYSFTYIPRYQKYFSSFATDEKPYIPYRTYQDDTLHVPGLPDLEPEQEEGEP